MLFSSSCRVARDGSSHRLLTISVFLCELVCALLSTGRVLWGPVLIHFTGTFVWRFFQSVSLRYSSSIVTLSNDEW
jgi:hypothetical protein